MRFHRKSRAGCIAPPTVGKLGAAVLWMILGRSVRFVSLRRISAGRRAGTFIPKSAACTSAAMAVRPGHSMRTPARKWTPATASPWAPNSRCGARDTTVRSPVSSTRETTPPVMKINRAMELHHGARHDAAQALFRHEAFKEFLIFLDSVHLRLASAPSCCGQRNIS